MSLTVSYGFCLSLDVSLSVMELLHVSHCLPWLLAVSQCISSLKELLHVSVLYGCWLSLTVPMELLHLSNYFLWLQASSHCLYGPMELSHMVAGMSIPVPWSCWLCLFIFHGFCLSVTVSSSAMEIMAVCHCLLSLLDISH